MMSLLILLAVGWKLGGATDTQRSHMYTNVGLNNKAFTDNVVFESSAKTAPHCALQCNQQDSCMAFTFDDKICRGHAAVMTSRSNSRPAVGARSFYKGNNHIDECVSAPCQNGGTCVDEVNGYLCQCAPGYTDQQCQTDINECASSPCQNGRHCKDDVNSYTCLCPAGFSGVNCNGDVDECVSAPCQNGATCVDQVNGYLCQCAPGFTDLQCQTDINECVSAPCQNGATCTDQVNGYLCTCAPGYTNLQCQTERKPRNCADTQLDSSVSGVVTIYPEDDNTPLQVYCDQDTDGGGWLVFQRRQDGSVDFDRTWTEYQNGFGDLQGDVWLGLDALHALTSRQKYELRVDLMKFDLTKANVTHNNFTISNSSDKYRLSIDRSLSISLNANGFLNDYDYFYEYDNGAQFSLWDSNKTDPTYKSNSDYCAYDDNFHGGWWINYLTHHTTSLNGRYQGNSTLSWDGIWWYGFDMCYTLKFSEMKMRPMSVRFP